MLHKNILNYRYKTSSILSQNNATIKNKIKYYARNLICSYLSKIAPMAQFVFINSNWIGSCCTHIWIYWTKYTEARTVPDWVLLLLLVLLLFLLLLLLLLLLMMLLLLLLILFPLSTGVAAWPLPLIFIVFMLATVELSHSLAVCVRSRALIRPFACLYVYMYTCVHTQWNVRKSSTKTKCIFGKLYSNTPGFVSFLAALLWYGERCRTAARPYRSRLGSVASMLPHDGYGHCIFLDSHFSLVCPCYSIVNVVCADVYS